MIFHVSHSFLDVDSKTSDEVRLESYKMGADAFLLKPFDENMLLARISNILEIGNASSKSSLLI